MINFSLLCMRTAKELGYGDLISMAWLVIYMPYKVVISLYIPFVPHILKSFNSWDKFVLTR